MMMLAWNIAMLERQKQLPKLKTLLARQGQGSSIYEIAARVGGQVRRTRLVRREVTH